MFPDLPSEALQIRKSLQSVLQCVQETNIKYRWSTLSELLMHRNKVHFAWDIESRKERLKNLNLKEPMDIEKCQSLFPITPQKNSKIPIRQSS